MVVLREPGEVYLLCHTGGDDAISWVERIDPETLETLERSSDLAAGPTWPGGICAHANGSLYVVFGRHVHQLSAALEVLRSRTLPRDRPYNSLVVLDGGELVMKDFGGTRPGENSHRRSEDCEILVLDPDTLETISSCVIAEASVARLSSSGREVYVVGVTRLFRLVWDGSTLEPDKDFQVLYVNEVGQGFGWDPVITETDVWFLDNGAGSERYAGSLLGCGEATSGQRLIRVERMTGALTALPVNDQPGALVANPPAVDVGRSVAIGYDSGNGVVSAFDTSSSDLLWSRQLNHAMHPIVFTGPGYVLLNDFDPVRQRDCIVVVETVTGAEVQRIDTASPLQSVLFAAAGFSNDVYVCSFSHVTRIAFVEPSSANDSSNDG